MEHSSSELKSIHERKRLRKKRLGWSFFLRPSTLKTVWWLGILIHRISKFLRELWAFDE